MGLGWGYRLISYPLFKTTVQNTTIVEEQIQDEKTKQAKRYSILQNAL